MADRPPDDRGRHRSPLPPALFWVVLFVLLAGAVYAFRLGDVVRYTDERDYLRLARNLAATWRYSYDGVEPTAIRTPGYPFFLALPLALGAPLFAVRLLGFLALAGTVVLTFLLLERIAGRRAASIGALLVLCYPVLFYTAGTFYPQTLSSLLLLGALYCLTPLETKGERDAGNRNVTIGARNWLLAGNWIALATILVPNFIFTILIVAAWILWRERRRAFVPLILFVLPSALVMGGWAVRNYNVFHTFIPLSTNGGVTLLNGNSSTTDPNSSYFDASRHVEDVDEVRRMSEVERDRYYRARAIAYMKENPGTVFRLYVLKVVNWFHYTNRIMTQGESSRTTDLVMMLTYWPLLLLAVLRVAMARKIPLGRLEILLVALYIGNGLLLSIFLPRIRYRLPFDHGLILLAAVYLDYLFVRFRPGARASEGRGGLRAKEASAR
jgi:4-amino-4-deoxy-L-arabinose transferase-like glycosyltransferase